MAFKTPVRDQQSNRNKEKLNNSNVTIAKGPSKGKTTSSADVDINSVNEGDDYSVDNPDEVGTTEINLTDNKLKKVTRKERKGKKADSEIPPTNWKLQMDETRRYNWSRLCKLLS